MSGKWLEDYEPVEDRLALFWSEHPDGRVWTEMQIQGTNPGDVIVIWAAVYRDATDPNPWATGLAHQRLLGAPPSGKFGKPNESSPEWTSPYEVCETSAIGRALANAGYAAKGKRPSREEVSKTESANELFDVTEWIELLSEEQQGQLRSWWKETPGLQTYSARAVPDRWMGPIKARIKAVKNAEVGQPDGDDGGGEASGSETSDDGVDVRRGPEAG